MGFLDNLRGGGSAGDRKDGLVQVRLSAHACPLCGCMVALDLASEHWAWHDLPADGNQPEQHQQRIPPDPLPSFDVDDPSQDPMLPT